MPPLEAFLKKADFVFRLKKALYVLRQVLQECYVCFHNFLMAFNYYKSAANTTLYI